MRSARGLLAAAALVVWPSSALANDALIAREQLKIGYQLAEEGKCAEAIPHLQESLRLDRRAITLINLAQCEERVGHLAEAMSHWVDAHARADAEGAKEIRDEADRRAAALEPRLAKLTVALAAGTPKETVVERDGSVLGAASLGVPLPVNPGVHTIVVKSPGHADATRSVQLGEGQSERLELSVGAAAAPTRAPDVQAPETRTSTSPLVWVGFGVAVPALVIGSVAGLLAAGAAEDAKRDCIGGACISPSAVDAAENGKTMGTLSTIAFAVGAVGVGVGVYGLLSPSKSPSRASAAVRIAPARVVLEGTF